jgi:hypothetical protein
LVFFLPLPLPAVLTPVIAVSPNENFTVFYRPMVGGALVPLSGRTRALESLTEVL